MNTVVVILVKCLETILYAIIPHLRCSQEDYRLLMHKQAIVMMTLKFKEDK